MDREGPSYTVETLEVLTKEHPKDDLVWILGGDQAARLRTWREPEKVLELATVAATERGAWRRPGIFVELAQLRNSRRLVFFEMIPIGLSSTYIRRRIARGQCWSPNPLPEMCRGFKRSATIFLSRRSERQRKGIRNHLDGCRRDSGRSPGAPEFQRMNPELRPGGIFLRRIR